MYKVSNAIVETILCKLPHILSLIDKNKLTNREYNMLRVLKLAVIKLKRCKKIDYEKTYQIRQFNKQ